jgi:hypothetical protein
MKKILLGTLAAAALSLSLTTTASADPNWSQVCTDNANFGLSHGECTSILNAYYNNGQGSNDVAAYCRQYRVLDALGDLNQGQCIKILKPYFPG